MTELINFTQDRIRNLSAPTDKDRADYYDLGCPKLICRLSSTGNKSFVVLKKTADGKTRRITLGRFPDLSVSEARKLAQAALTDLANGINPTEEKRKQRFRNITLADLFDRYLADKSELREASVKDYTKIMNSPYGFSDWLKKPINEITRDMVLARRKQFTGGADNKMRVLRLLMNYAIALKAIDENPVDVMRDGSLWAKPTRRKRMIPSDNLRDWYNAVLHLENEQAKVYLLLLLHTGLRDQDVRYLEWKDVDFKNDCFIARDTKNHSDFTAYIAPQIKPYLRALQDKTGKGRIVFPGGNVDGVMDVPRKPIAQICKKTGVTFSSHDLKRTFLTIGEAAMIPFSLLKALANHQTDGDVTGGYLNPEANTMKAATFKIANEIQDRTKPDDENIQSLKIG
ncbi:integrase arm-type DNA-binding domain-containing protein [Methylobacter sp. G7]|uniref:tyrosine-type recombinase/integrase n=1 Tax=Methylobacter sp. G7 TaxID=3230117 RepID=UPI003D802FB2